MEPIRPLQNDHDATYFPGYDKQNAIRQQINQDAHSGPDRDLTIVHGNTGHVKKWDPVTAANLDRVERDLTLRPPKQGWVVVLHPWPITVNAGRMMREPAPPAGLELIRKVKDEDVLLVHRLRTQGVGKIEEPDAMGVGVLQIPFYEPDMKPEENGSFTCIPVLPIEQAGQFLREGNSNTLWGPGVLIYEGELPPDQMWAENAEISLYDPLGKPIVEKKTIKARQRGSLLPVQQQIDVPITGKFRDIFLKVDEERIANYLRLVNEGNEGFVSSEGKQKKWAVPTGTTLRPMAHVLFRRGIIKKLPEWAVETRLDKPQVREKCISCSRERDSDEANLCACGWPYDPLAAYKLGLIAFEHVSIHALGVKELEQAYKIKAQREEQKAKLEEKFSK